MEEAVKATILLVLSAFILSACTTEGDASTSSWHKGQHQVAEICLEVKYNVEADFFRRLFVGRIGYSEAPRCSKYVESDTVAVITRLGRGNQIRVRLELLERDNNGKWRTVNDLSSTGDRARNETVNETVRRILTRDEEYYVPKIMMGLH